MIEEEKEEEEEEERSESRSKGGERTREMRLLRSGINKIRCVFMVLLILTDYWKSVTGNYTSNITSKASKQQGESLHFSGIIPFFA